MPNINNSTTNFKSGEKKNQPRLLGGVGEKLSNGGTEWNQQNRVYDSEAILLCVTTVCNPFYAIRKKEEK